MTNKKCLLGTIASYCLRVKLAVGASAACGDRAYPDPIQAVLRRPSTRRAVARAIRHKGRAGQGRGLRSERFVVAIVRRIRIKRSDLRHEPDDRGAEQADEGERKRPD